jgi:hypothetical protein
MIKGLRFDMYRFLSLRSTWWLVAGVIGVQIAAEFAVAAFLRWGPLASGGYSASEALKLIVAGPPLASVGTCLLGAVIGGSDWRHGTRDLTILVMPSPYQRLMVRITVMAALAGGVASMTGLGAFAALGLVGLEDLFNWSEVAVTVGHAGRVIAYGLFGLSLGLLTKSQVGACASVMACAVVVEPILRGLQVASDGRWAQVLAEYSPLATFDALVPEVMGDVFVAPAFGSLAAILVSCCYLSAAFLGGLSVERASKATGHALRLLWGQALPRDGDDVAVQKGATALMAGQSGGG